LQPLYGVQGLSGSDGDGLGKVVQPGFPIAIEPGAVQQLIIGLAVCLEVMLAGRLTHDPKVRVLKTGTSVADIGLAVNERVKTKEGTWDQKTLFVRLKRCTGRFFPGSGRGRSGGGSAGRSLYRCRMRWYGSGCPGCSRAGQNGC
ncbi:MAG: hypothetical protein EOM20_10400, partial [Spartobacteria bacterium]|nr:hypothetical protein [Spartobacteria bacterium]